MIRVVSNKHFDIIPSSPEDDVKRIASKAWDQLKILVLLSLI